MPLAQSDLDALWDFDDPAASAARLRDAATAAPDPVVRRELRTQFARALGLQQRFSEAHAVLDAIDPEPAVVAVRLELERGRLHNSAGSSAEAVTHFRIAADRARDAGLRFLLVDALHMLAIADAEHAAGWTAQAFAALDGETDPRTLRWLVSLHNNRGWSLADAGDTEDALLEFQAALDAARRYGTPQQVAWAEEAIAEVGGDS